MNLSDPEVRRTLSPTAIRGFFNIAKEWCWLQSNAPTQYTVMPPHALGWGRRRPRITVQWNSAGPNVY
jgi:hypothetical protein